MMAQSYDTKLNFVLLGVTSRLPIVSGSPTPFEVALGAR